MLLIPAMELNHGQCVYSHRDAEDEASTVVAENPLEIADKLVNEGATRLHVVDVEAIMSGEPENVAVIQKIRQKYPELSIQVSGNIRKEEHIYVWLDAGANFVILSSQASKRRSFIEDMCIEFPRQIMVALETKNGQLKSSGTSKLDFYQRAIELEELGISGIIYTDVPESGRVNGNNLSSANQLAHHVEIPIIANGGINTINDIQTPHCQDCDKLSAVVIGKPIFEKKFTFKEAFQALNSANKVTA